MQSMVLKTDNLFHKIPPKKQKKPNKIENFTNCLTDETVRDNIINN